MARRSSEKAAGDEGSATPELLLVLPALMLLIAAALQLALYGLAAHALSLAVAEGGATARADAGSPGGALSLVRADVARLAGGLVSDLEVKVGESDGGVVTVSARVSVVSLLPGLHLSVGSTSTGPSQVFRPTG